MAEGMQQFIAGAIVALIPIVVLELGIRPWRTRRNIARLLLPEIEQNIMELAELVAMREAQPRSLPRNVNLSRLAFDAVVDQLGELHGEAPGRVLDLYAALVDFERTASGVASIWQEIKSEPAAFRHEAYLKGQSIVSENIEHALTLAVQARATLQETIYTGWSDAPQRFSVEAVKATGRELYARSARADSGVGA